MMTETPTTMDFNADAESLQLLCELVEIIQDHEAGLRHVLERMYSLMQANLLCSTQLMHQVISAVISGSQEETSTRRSLLARALVCVQLQLRKIPADDGVLLLQELLARTSGDDHPYSGQILGHLFDDFVRVLGADCFLRLLDATGRLLLSEEPHDRNSSYFLISKIQMMCEIDGERSEALLHFLQCSAQQWTAFAVIMVDLKEQESHLVVSTLEKQLSQLQLMSSDLGERWLSWLRILCLRLLQEDRVQVLRKALEYFLTNLSMDLVFRSSLLPEFLVATNRSQLFDFEDNNCIKEEELKHFIADGNMELLLGALVEVPWEDVPLILWIRSLNSEQVKSVPKELLIKLCIVVGAIDNYVLRWRAQDNVFRLFKDTIDGLSLRDYMICIESLFNKGDAFTDYYRLKDKISKCTDFEEHIDGFNRRSLEILSWDYSKQSDIFNILRCKMQTLPKNKHGFLRLALYPYDLDFFADFYRKLYNVDISLLKKGASLEKIQEHLLDRLNCQTSEETSFLKAQCVDLFSSNLDSWGQLEELNLDPLELIKQGTNHTIFVLTRLLGAHEQRIKDERVLPALIARVRFYDDIENVVRYAYNNSTEEQYERCITDLFIQKEFVCLADIKRTTSLYIKLLLHGEPKRGLARIEAACVYNLLCVIEPNAQIRFNATWHLISYGNDEMKSTIFKEFVKLNEKLSIEHPHYTENSKVHRQKMRIATALIEIRENCDDPESLKTLLLASDHLGINLMHEFLIGNCVESVDWVLKALPSLQPRQQESYLSIAYIFIFKNLLKLNQEKKLSDMFFQLLPLTMGSCHSTRILAQLILHKLSVKCEENRILIPLADFLINSVRTSCGKRLHELQNDPRLLLTDVSSAYDLLYLANVPFDEMYRFRNCYNRLREGRQAFTARQAPLPREVKTPKNLSEGLPVTPSGVNNPDQSASQDFILVASLLDKDIDFAGLKSICKKFGFNSLIVAEKSHLEESSSSNLRTVEVKTEILLEFILSKQAEGYTIVGYRDSADIPKFGQFEFPKKCLLVLGHERHGIPSNVMEVLDYVVKIPQFGSLDTNLVASLLIWEFFKQHCA